MPGQFDAALGDAAEVRNADLRFHEARDRVHEAFGLAQRQVEYLTYQNGSFYGVIGVHQWSAACAQFDWMPLLNRFFSKPDRDVAAPPQCVVVFGPVGHLVFGLGELVAATLVMFVGHWLLLKVDSTRIMPVGRNGGQFPIYSTTPWAVTRRAGGS